MLNYDIMIANGGSVMKNSIVRIQRIELENFKNVLNGIIEFKSNPKNEENYNPNAEIIGIYGQNGSGKTALVNACDFIKKIMEGSSLPKDTANYINVFSKTASISMDFYIQTNKNKYIVNYTIELEKIRENDVKISKEVISYSIKKEKWTKKVPSLCYDSNNIEDFLTPKSKFNEIILQDKENLVNIKVAQKLAVEKNKSFIFNEDVKEILKRSIKDKEIITIIDTLTYFSRCNFFVIKNEHSGIISLDYLMPFSFRLEESEGIASGDIAIGLNGPSYVDESVYSIITKVVTQMNIVLNKIVPDLKVELHNYGKEINEKGKETLKVELLSVKEDINLPIKYESEGIKKIISILSTLIAMYNNKSICVVVDELDSGIYEFLLGEILSVIEKGGKGQLIFTSHNLRPLEILNKDAIYFTTTNLKNRYIRFSNVKNNNNLRSLYIRSINLGGQKEELYNETDNDEIRRAFRLAGERSNGL